MIHNTTKEMDEITIQNIGHATWLCTMDHYPKTVKQMKLLVSIVDKIGIFNKFNLTKTSGMDAKKLNIIYAILRITNKLFNGYLDHVAKKIFRDSLKEIFVCTNLNYYDLFFDQLTQDIDHFVCSLTKTNYLNITEGMVKNKLVDYLHFTFRKTFYINIMKKLSYDVKESFYQKNDQLFQSMASEFVLYTKETLAETYDTMKMFLEKIFSNDCSDQIVNEITNALEKHIDLKTLFSEQCLEIDIYCEQKLDDELEWNDMRQEENNEIAETNLLLQDIGYQIYNDNMAPGKLSILQPFINHHFAKSEKDLFNILLRIFTEYSHDMIIDRYSSISIENYYTLSMAMIGPDIDSYQSFCEFLAENEYFPDIYPIDLVFRVISRIYNIKIELVNEDLSVLKIDNTVSTVLDEPIIIYKKNQTYYTLCIIGCSFVPIYQEIKNPKQVLKSFRRMANKNKKNSNILRKVMLQRTE